MMVCRPFTIPVVVLVIGQQYPVPPCHPDKSPDSKSEFGHEDCWLNKVVAVSNTSAKKNFWILIMALIVATFHSRFLKSRE